MTPARVVEDAGVVKEGDSCPTCKPLTLGEYSAGGLAFRHIGILAECIPSTNSRQSYLAQHVWTVRLLAILPGLQSNLHILVWLRLDFDLLRLYPCTLQEY